MARDVWKRTDSIIELALQQVEKLIAPVFEGTAVLGVEPASGGLANTNLRVSLAGLEQPVLLRIYQRDPGQAIKEVRINELVRNKVPSPRFHHYSESNPFTGHPYVIMDWIDGVRLETMFSRLPPDQIDSLANSVGTTLSAIHSFNFDKFGFFDSDLKVQTEIDLGRAGLLAFANECLNNRAARSRLGEELSDRALAFLDREASIMDADTSPPCLVHADFGGSNILVSDSSGEWKVAAVLDWEFAFSGNPYMDLGNLLRKPLGAVPNFESCVIQAYRDAGGKLPQDWKRKSLLSDMFAWFDFVGRENISAELLDDCLINIQNTIDQWHHEFSCT